MLTFCLIFVYLLYVMRIGIIAASAGGHTHTADVIGGAHNAVDIEPAAAHARAIG